MISWPRVIYLDNAATTFPKPESVYRALDAFARIRAANPGRSGHRMAVDAERAVQEAREGVARLFHAPSADRIVLAFNATDALNIAIKGLGLAPGDHVVTSPLEHNSINRPLAAMEGRLQVMLQAVQTVRPPLDRFYQQLSDEQKARFNAVSPGGTSTAGEDQRGLTKLCHEQAPGVTDLPFDRIAQATRPTPSRGRRSSPIRSPCRRPARSRACSSPGATAAPAGDKGAPRSPPAAG